MGHLVTIEGYQKDLRFWSMTCGCPKPSLYWSNEFEARICQNCGVIITESENVVAGSFVHLRVHTNLSFLRATCKVDDLIQKAKLYKMPALAKTEFNNMCGAPSFVKDCVDAGIKPILGTEFNVCLNKNVSHPVTFIALNHQGYKNLVKMNTTAWCSRDMKDPFITVDDIIGDGIIALVETIFNPEYMRPIIDALVTKIEIWLEVTNHINNSVDIAQCIQASHKLPIIVTNNVLYTNVEDHGAYEVALKIGRHSILHTEPEYYFKSPNEMYQIGFPHEWYENTLAIANRVQDYGIISKEFVVPTFKDKNGEWGIDQSHAKLVMDGWNGLAAKGLINKKEYVDRLEYELSVMNEKKFSSYFLIINEIVEHIKSKGWLKPVGRGCLTGDVLVLTSGRGYIPLKDIIVGDKVITHTGEVKDVLSTFKYDINEELLEINSEYSNNNIKLTKDHEVYAYKRKHESYRKSGIDKLSDELENAEPSWIRAENLSIGDYIYTPFLTSRRVITQPIKYDLSKYIPKGKELIFNIGSDIITQYIFNTVKKSEREISRSTGKSRSYLRKYRTYNINENSKHLELNRFIDVDNNFAYFIGRWVGDGWITSPDSGKRMVGLAFHKDDITGRTKILNYLNSVGFEVKTHYHSTRKCVQLLIYNTLLYNLLHNMFPKYTYIANTKSLGYVKYWPNELLKNVMLGLKDSDGHYELPGMRKERENIDTTSYQLMLDIQEVLFYIKTPCYVQTRTQHNHKNWSTSYKIRFHGLTTNNKHYLVTSHGYYSKIKKISKTTSDTVYDISVKDNKSYLVKSGIVHNSSVGSLVCYCLDITSMDPIKWNVPFERFINQGRIDLPDIDTDITQEGRGEVLKHIADIHGHDKVAQIATYQTMGLKAAIDNVGGALGVPHIQNRELRNKIPEEIDSIDELDDSIKNELSKVNGWIEYSESLSGISRHLGSHAAGIVISNQSLGDLVPLLPETDGLLGIQYDMRDVEILGLLKLDMLGLRNLDIIQHTLKRMKRLHGTEIDIYNLPPNDPATYQLISDGNYVSIFQLDSPGYRKLCRQLKPDKFEHVMALNALFRPGPLGGGMTDEYVSRRHGKSDIIGWHPWLDDVLASTYQVPVFQEQVMEISKRIAGFDDVEADKYRKAIGKKDQKKFDKAQEKFKEGALKRNGLSIPSGFKGNLEGWIDYLLKKLAGYARYGWNLGHSCLDSNSLILTCNRGLVPIKDIVVGEEIWSVRENTCDLFRNRVVDVINNGVRDTVRVRSSDGRELMTTPDHGYFTSEKKYKNASELNHTDSLKMLKKGVFRRHLNIFMTSVTYRNKIPVIVGFYNFVRNYVMKAKSNLRSTKYTGAKVSIQQSMSQRSTHFSAFSYFDSRPSVSEEPINTTGINEYSFFSKPSRNGDLAFVPHISYLKDCLSYFWRNCVDAVTTQATLFDKSGKSGWAGFERKFSKYIFAPISFCMEFSYQLFILVVWIPVAFACDTISSIVIIPINKYMDTTTSAFNYFFPSLLSDTPVLSASITNSGGSIVGNVHDVTTSLTNNFNHIKPLEKISITDVMFNCIIPNKPCQVWDLMMEQDPNFIANGFVVHNCGYGWITYITAYLEAHYPAEYYASLLDDTTKTEKISSLIRGILSKGFKIVPPNVNESNIGYDVSFNTDKNAVIYMGLSSVRNVGGSAADIVNERENGKFGSFIEFCQRLPSINKTAKINLVKAGAFDWDKSICNRDKIDNIDTIQKIIKRKNKSFDGTKIASLQIAMECYITNNDFTDIQKQQNEREVLHSFITGHPAAIYQRLAPHLERQDTFVICPSMLKHCTEGQAVLLVGMIDSLRKRTIAKEGRNKGKPYLVINISDNEESVIFNVWWPLCDDMEKYLVPNQVAMFECVTRADKFRENTLTLSARHAIMLTHGLPIQGIFCPNECDPIAVITKIGGMVQDVLNISGCQYASVRGGRVAVMPDVLENVITEVNSNVKFLVSMEALGQTNE